VLVDIPKDMTTPSENAPTSIRRIGETAFLQPVVKGHRADQEGGRSCCSEAKRPMIYTGGGVILGGAAEALTQARAKLWATRSPTP
jgi:acetolactate synthase-1/2/3 large subunit